MAEERQVTVWYIDKYLIMDAKIKQTFAALKDNLILPSWFPKSCQTLFNLSSTYPCNSVTSHSSNPYYIHEMFVQIFRSQPL